MKKQPIERHYVSPLDQFLKKWDKEHPHKSASQLAEIKKYARVFKLRDDPNASDGKKDLWEDF